MMDWMKSLEVTPTIVALRNRVDDMKRAEVDKVLARLPHLSPQDRELVESLASSIVNKLIHRTMVTLKAEVNSSSGPAFVEAARRFFSLDRPSQSVQQVETYTTPSCRTESSVESGVEDPTPHTSIHKQAR
jgi:glutamyl-tRNA reductase